MCLDEWWIDEILYTGTTQKKQFSAPGSKKKKKKKKQFRTFVDLNEFSERKKENVQSYPGVRWKIKNIQN